MGSGWSNTSGRRPDPAETTTDTPYSYPPGVKVTKYENEEEVGSMPEGEAAQPEPEEAAETKPALKVKFVDYCIKKNSEDHHTDDYKLVEGWNEEDDGCTKPPELVIRRGQQFEISLVFDRDYDQSQDYLHIMFEIGSHPKESKKTLVHLDLEGIVAGQWCSTIKNVQGKEVTLGLQADAECIVGIWRFVIHTSVKGKPKEINRCVHKRPIYIIFNPWCKQDAVYMEDKVGLDEYVLNDKGKIFTGSAKQIGSRPWNFGQFEDNVLDCAMYLLEESRLNYQTRGSVVHVTRAISAMVNEANDKGILVGNWSGNYQDGIAPTKWVGSVKIIEQYFNTKKPVEYGQCWVFSGVSTSIARALGIPTRSVTNFSSAHDTDGSITIDKHFNIDGKPNKELDEDSVWNFHVWNEAWMERRDLPPGYGGWQAFDATPQETSGGIYQAGPASIKAIKEGDVNRPFDAGFIFAEINADRIHWGQGEDGRYNKVMRIQKNSIGKNISTHKPRMIKRESLWGLFSRQAEKDRLDVTDEYKHAENSEPERAAVYRANMNAKTNLEAKVEKYSGWRKEQAEQGLEKANLAYSSKLGVQDVNFSLNQKDGVMVGSLFNVELEMQNTSREERNVYVELEIFPVHYTGILKDKRPIKTQKFNITLPPVKSKEATMRVTMDDYIDKLVEQYTFEIDVFARVKETAQEYPDTELYRLRRPDLIFSAPNKVKVGQSFSVTIELHSPMPVHLTECEWEVEGAHLLRPKNFSRENVEPYEHIKLQLDITPKKKGHRELMASFSSLELTDITGSCEIEVEE